MPLQSAEKPRMSRHYRLYLTDVRGHFLSVIELVCANDAEALAEATDRAGGQGAELWERARRVRAWGGEHGRS